MNICLVWLQILNKNLEAHPRSPSLIPDTLFYININSLPPFILKRLVIFYNTFLELTTQIFKSGYLQFSHFLHLQISFLLFFLFLYFFFCLSSFYISFSLFFLYFFFSLSLFFSLSPLLFLLLYLWYISYSLKNSFLHKSVLIYLFYVLWVLSFDPINEVS